MVFPFRCPIPTQRLKPWLDKVADAYGNVPGTFRLVWQAHPVATVVLAILTVVTALVPVSQAWLGKLIVDTVVAAVQLDVGAMAGLRLTLPYLLAEFGLLLLATILGQARSLTENVLYARLNLHVNTLIIRKALELDLSFFENAEYYDKLQNARREADWRGLRIVNAVFLLLQNVLTLASFAAVLIRFSPWLALVLFGATIPAFLAQIRYGRLHFRLLSWRAPEARRMYYFEHLLTQDESAKEVKLFGLGELLLKRYTDIAGKTIREDETLARRRSLASVGWGLLATLSYYGAYAWIIFRAAGGLITLGDMTLYVSVLRQSQQTFRAVVDGLAGLYENSLFISNLFGFLKLQPLMSPNGARVPMPPRVERGIEFQGVSFRYPGRTEWALREIKLHIRPGEKLALVGANGAGKTTLIKLLTRLYDPTEGRILLDGVDLRNYDLNELRQKIGVIFQDFVKYQLTARENVGFGQIEALDDALRLLNAAERGGAAPVLASLPEGYDTTLGRWFKGGHELSAGEWQKVALSRAFMRDGEVLVLDEPTAALDAENEAVMFQRVRDLTEGKIAVLISHRFSTVRVADRIAVIEDGRITELGSHQDLLTLNGTYARLFNLQAEGYR